MKGTRPRQHRRRCKSGKTITVNKGMKPKVKRRRSENKIWQELLKDDDFVKKQNEHRERFGFKQLRVDPKKMRKINKLLGREI